MPGVRCAGERDPAVRPRGARLRRPGDARRGGPCPRDGAVRDRRDRLGGPSRAAGLGTRAARGSGAAPAQGRARAARRGRRRCAHDRPRDRQAPRGGVHVRALRLPRQPLLACRKPRQGPRARAHPGAAAVPATQAGLAALRAGRGGRDRLRVELPAGRAPHPGGLRCGSGQRGRPEALRADAADGALRRGALPARGRSGRAGARRAGPGRDDRRRARAPAGCPQARLHRLGRGRPGRGRAGSRAPLPDHARARRQGSHARPRRRGPRPCDRGRAVGVVRQLRAGLLGRRAHLRGGPAVRALPRSGWERALAPSGSGAATTPAQTSARS